MKKYFLILAMLFCIVSQQISAIGVTVKMNTITKTMTLTDKSTGTAVDIGTPTSNQYEFSVAEGTYVLTGYATNGTTVNGTIELNITADNNTFQIWTATTYATNSGWVLGTDYEILPTVTDKMGNLVNTTLGSSITSGRSTVMMLNGNTYDIQLIPSATPQAEGYMATTASGTATFNPSNASKAIPMGYEWSATAPADVTFFLGLKSSHFVPFTEVEPLRVEFSGTDKVYTYKLAASQQYNYRASRNGKLTLAGIFTMNANPDNVPALNFTEADFEAHSPAAINHDVQANAGYETGNIYLLANEKGHLHMNINQERDMLAMRSWQLVNNVTGNYFIEPTFHYTVLNTNFQPDNSVLQLDRYTTDQNPWVKMKAVGQGTAIVLVTYDAIQVNTYNGATKGDFAGGDFWGAIWPENTGVYVVTVGDEASLSANMTINETYNTSDNKVADKNVDAEHDVFYYLDTEDGADYTFTPTGVSSIEIAYPTIGANSAAYTGFASDGVIHNADGSYTLRLREGRQIVRLGDGSGHYTYQVLTAKPCHREISNLTRTWADNVQPGDQVKIQYTGLHHPANKLAGIYNMSAFVTYNNVPNGTTIVEGSNQYTFGSAANAQAVTATIPADWDVAASPQFVMNEGVLEAKGFGDPYGNHRLISRQTGRNANFTAVQRDAYFGQLPDIRINLTPVKLFTVNINSNISPVSISIKDKQGNTASPETDGTYSVTYGNFSYEAKADGYKTIRANFTIDGDSPDIITLNIQMQPLPVNGWDGENLTQPAVADGIYQITTGSELAWFAHAVNTDKNYTAKAALLNDIDLCGFDWKPIGGTSTSTAFQGTLDGNHHTVSGLYINSTATHQALFGYINKATIQRLTVSGEVNTTANYAAGLAAYTNASTILDCVNQATVNGKQYVSGITAYATGASTINRCGNQADIIATGTYAAGITAYPYAATTSIQNCYNTATITGTGNVATITANVGNANTTVQNCLNIGTAVCTGSTVGNVYSGSTKRNNITNNYVLQHYNNGTNYETVVTPEQLRSGEVALALGEEWGQTIGTDPYPLPGRQLTLNLSDNAYAYLPAFAPSGALEGTVVAHVDYKKQGLDGTGWYSCVLPYTFDLPEGITAISNAVIEGNTISFTTLTGTVPANTPFLYKVEGGGNINFQADNIEISVATNPASSDLLGTYQPIGAGEATGKLILNNDGSAFGTATATASIPAFRAYLNPPTSSSHTYTITIDGQPTGIMQIDNADGAIGDTHAVYDLQGRKISQKHAAQSSMINGQLYIINGKKTIIR